MCVNSESNILQVSRKAQQQIAVRVIAVVRRDRATHAAYRMRLRAVAVAAHRALEGGVADRVVAHLLVGYRGVRVKQPVERVVLETLREVLCRIRAARHVAEAIVAVA